MKCAEVRRGVPSCAKGCGVYMCAPGPSDAARGRRGSIPVLAERPLRGIDGRRTGEPMGDEGLRTGVEGRKLGERGGVIRPATMGARGCGASCMEHGVARTCM